MTTIRYNTNTILKLLPNYVIEISYYVGPSTINHIMSYTGNFYFVNNVKTIYLETRQQLGVEQFCETLFMLEDILFCSI